MILRGCLIVSRLSNYYPSRFIGFAFLTGSYIPVGREFDLDTRLETMRAAFGYDIFGYWAFFSEEDADQIIESHWDSFFGIIYPSDPILWKTNMAPRGAMKDSVLADEKFPLPSYMTEDDKRRIKESLLSEGRGMKAPLTWYRMAVGGVLGKDESQIPPDRQLPPTATPIFFGAALQDYICLAVMGKKLFAGEAFSKHESITIRDFDADHWLMINLPEEVNRELGAWVDETLRKEREKSSATTSSASSSSRCRVL